MKLPRPLLFLLALVLSTPLAGAAPVAATFSAAAAEGGALAFGMPEEAPPVKASPALQVGDQAEAETARGTEEIESLSGLAESSRQWLAETREEIVRGAPRFAVRVLVFLVVLLVFRILAGVLRSFTDRGLRAARLNVSDLLRRFVTGIVYKGIFWFGVIFAAAKAGLFDLTPFLAGIGVAGVVIGFALQETLSNFAAGVMILLYRPYDIGDVISAGGVTGKVDSMSLISTRILTPDNQILIVPNGKIWGGVITNVTANPIRRVDLVASISYEDDIAKAERVLRELVEGHELVLDDPEPVIRVHELADSSVNFIVRPWTKTPDYWTVYWDLTRAIKERFDAEGISIPYPQRDVHLHRAGESAA